MTRSVRLVLGSIMAVVVLGVVSCGMGAEPEIPAWAKVSPEQITEAKRQGAPVAFENDSGMRFVLVPSGTFWMGSPEGEEGRFSDETRHRVTFSRPFYMQVTEVTNGQYRRFKPPHDSGEYEGHSLNGEKQPVVDVSWEDATAYAEWLMKRDGKRTYELPTEAQWEYACRAGTTTRYSWGESEREAGRHTNVCDNTARRVLEVSGGLEADDGHAVASPVGSYQPNWWGLFDLHGNVWEWCSDGYRKEYPTGHVTDPSGPSSGTRRVLRGGSWRHSPRYVRSAYRRRSVPDYRYLCDGFRLVSPLASGE